MDKLPFSIYDFFAYLASGFVLLIAIDYSFDGGWLLRKDIGIVVGAFWVMFAYVVGHIIANIAGFFIETNIVQDKLRAPHTNLFVDHNNPFCIKLFPGFYTRLPQEICERVINKANSKASINSPGKALFFHCIPIVRRDASSLDRMESFLNLYGFCRNICMASILAVPILSAGIIIDWRINGTDRIMRRLRRKF